MRDPEEGEDLSREIHMYKRALNPLNGFIVNPSHKC